jgi:hypothetical protein
VGVAVERDEVDQVRLAALGAPVAAAPERHLPAVMVDVGPAQLEELVLAGPGAHSGLDDVRHHAGRGLSRHRRSLRDAGAQFLDYLYGAAIGP